MFSHSLLALSVLSPVAILPLDQLLQVLHHQLRRVALAERGEVDDVAEEDGHPLEAPRLDGPGLR